MNTNPIERLLCRRRSKCDLREVVRTITGSLLKTLTRIGRVLCIEPGALGIPDQVEHDSGVKANTIPG